MHQTQIYRRYLTFEPLCNQGHRLFEDGGYPKVESAIMTLSFLLVFSLGIFVGVLPTPSVLAQSISSSNAFLPYENSTLGISMQYPYNWQKIEASGGVGFRSNDTSFEQVGLSVSSSNVPLNESINNVINYIKQSHPDFQLLTNQSTSLKNSSSLAPGTTLVYTYTDRTLGMLKAMKLFTANLGEDRHYTISYFAIPDKYDVYLPTVQKMIDSFQVMNISSGSSPARQLAKPQPEPSLTSSPVGSNQSQTTSSEPTLGQSFVHQGSISSTTDPMTGHQKEQAAILLLPRKDNAIYNGVLTFSSDKPVDVELLQQYIPTNDMTATGEPQTSTLGASNYAITSISTSASSSLSSIPFSANSIALHSAMTPFTARYTINALAEPIDTSRSGSIPLDQAFVLQQTTTSTSNASPAYTKGESIVVLQPRDDGGVYTGVLTFSASKPVSVQISHASGNGFDVSTIYHLKLKSRSLPFTGAAALVISTSGGNPFAATYTVNAVPQSVNK